MFVRVISSAARCIMAPALAILLTGVAAHTPAAAADGSFAPLAGSWNGGGQIVLSSGSKERIRCRATYAPDAPGTNVQIELRCASDSYKFELKSDVTNSGGRISGSWSETTRGASGIISGTASAGQIDVRANGPTFSALLTLTTRGNRQTILIESPGSEMSQVSIALSKAKR
jgi:hypothetical protein